MWVVLIVLVLRYIQFTQSMVVKKDIFFWTRIHVWHFISQDSYWNDPGCFNKVNHFFFKKKIDQEAQFFVAQLFVKS